MKLVQLLFKREMAAPMLAISFASAVSVALVVGRIAWTGNPKYAFLIWNLFLAWLPMIFVVLARERQKPGSNPGWRFLAFAGAWLLFFPNAPYIFTDLVHLTRQFYQHFWVDLVLILTCALTGLVIGFVSLYLMQSSVRRMAGATASWVFIAAIAGLSGIGICLGRFLRLNSWDVLLRPGRLVQRLGDWMGTALDSPLAIALPVLFGAFLFTAYLMLYALTHLSQAQLQVAEK